MMDDIVGDYKDKTVTLEDFPFFANNIKMASVHPCKHASVMKTLLDRADAALRIRREKLKAGKTAGRDQGMEGLVDEVAKLDVKSAQEAADKDEWEEVQGTEVDEQEVAIRVDQYLVVFLKVSLETLFLLSTFCIKNRFFFFFLCARQKQIMQKVQSQNLLTPSPTPSVYGERHARHRARLHHGRIGNSFTFT